MEETGEQKSTGDTRKEELPAWAVGRIKVRCPSYMTGHSLSTAVGEL